tara:strand:+ start:932 stop:1246 length:315 start_codon:yes stop_codon:yes gene_type:complete
VGRDVLGWLEPHEAMIRIENKEKPTIVDKSVSALLATWQSSLQLPLPKSACGKDVQESQRCAVLLFWSAAKYAPGRFRPNAAQRPHGLSEVLDLRLEDRDSHFP